LVLSPFRSPTSCGINPRDRYQHSGHGSPA
jgi:hypothetical protein